MILPLYESRKGNESEKLKAMPCTCPDGRCPECCGKLLDALFARHTTGPADDSSQGSADLHRVRSGRVDKRTGVTQPAKKNQLQALNELAPRESKRFVATTPAQNDGHERQSKPTNDQLKRDRELKNLQLPAPLAISVENNGSNSSSATHGPGTRRQPMLPSSGERQRDQMPMPPPKLPTPNATSVDGHGSAPSSRTQDSEKERQERLIKEQQAKEKRRLIARMAMEEAKLDRERKLKAQLEKQQQLKEHLASRKRKSTLAEKLKDDIEKRLRMSGYGGSQRDLGSLKPGSQYYQQRKALIKRTLVQQLGTSSNPTTAKLASLKLRKKQLTSQIAAAKKEVADLEDESLDADVKVTTLQNKLKSNQDKLIQFAHLVEQAKAFKEGSQSQVPFWKKTSKTNPMEAKSDQRSEDLDVDGKRAEELRTSEKKAKKTSRRLKKARDDLKTAKAALQKAQMNAQQKTEQRSVVREEVQALREQCVQKTAPELDDLKDYQSKLKDLKAYLQELDGVKPEELESKKKIELKKQLKDIIDTASETAKRFKRRIKQMNTYSAPGDLPPHFTPPSREEEEGGTDPEPECPDRPASGRPSPEGTSSNAIGNVDCALADPEPSVSGSVLDHTHEPSKSTTDGFYAKWNYSEGRSRQPNMARPSCSTPSRRFNIKKRPARATNDAKNTSSPPSESRYLVSHVFAAREYSSEEEEVQLELPRLAGKLSAITCATSRHLLALSGKKATAINHVIKKPSASSPDGTANAPIVLNESDESDGENHEGIPAARSLGCITSRVIGAKEGKAKTSVMTTTAQKSLAGHPSASPVKAAVATSKAGFVDTPESANREQNAAASTQQRLQGRVHKIPK